VAIDQASIDLINRFHGIRESALQQSFQENDDKLHDIYSTIDYRFTLEYAQELGLGSRKYKLIE